MEQFAIAVAGTYLCIMFAGVSLYWFRYWFIWTPEQRKEDRAYHVSEAGWLDRQW